MHWIEGIWVSERASFTYIRSFREHDFQTHALVGNCERRASRSVNHLVGSATVGKTIRRHGQGSLEMNSSVDKEWAGMNFACDVALGTGYVTPVSVHMEDIKARTGVTISAA